MTNSITGASNEQLQTVIRVASDSTTTLSLTVNTHPLTRQDSENKDDKSPRLFDTHPKDDKLTDQDKLNFYGRWIENGRFLGAMPAAVVAATAPSEGAEFDAELEGMVDKIGGVVIGTAMHLAFRNKYKKVKSLNPLYRNFKTLATAGTEVGIIVGDFFRIPLVIATAIFALVVGLFAIPYWLYRERYYKDVPVEDLNKDYKTGVDGWSKYAKTSLVFGMYVGEVIGVLIAFAIRSEIVLRSILFFGAIGSVIVFAASLICVPIINKLTNGVLVTDKNTFRNNYVRSGITLGIAVGSTIGFFLLPGLAPLASIAVGAAFGSVIGGITIGVAGCSITEYIRKNWHVKEDTDNSWDYATRNSSYLLGFIGAAIGFFVPVPGGALVGAAIGNSIASVVGWGVGLIIIRQARITAPEELKAKTLPWTQRIANGTMIGSMIGGTLGFCLGLIGGSGGAILGATLGFSAGALIGGLTYGLWDTKARELIALFFQGKTDDSVGEEEITKPEPAPANEAAPAAEAQRPPLTINSSSVAAITTMIADATPTSTPTSSSSSASSSTPTPSPDSVSPDLPLPKRRHSEVTPVTVVAFQKACDARNGHQFFDNANSSRVSGNVNTTEFETVAVETDENDYSGLKVLFKTPVLRGMS